MEGQQQVRGMEMLHAPKDWEAYFASMADAELKSAYMVWGRPNDASDDDGSLDAWVAVNNEMMERGL